MGRLAGVSTGEVESDRIGVARAFAMKYRIYLILKGARTIIAAPDGAVAINGSGNPGMASGGMGDLLTGGCGARGSPPRLTLWPLAQAGRARPVEHPASGCC